MEGDRDRRRRHRQKDGSSPTHGDHEDHRQDDDTNEGGREPARVIVPVSYI